ncbi:antitoxin VbhA family protein [Avibacterium volantium]|uniref:antitoxin VbhA family protein n=1 Tax=Avibacterium TaxID=292486 RepID=UPI0039FBF2EF
MLNEQEKQARQKALQFAINNRLEGLHLSPEILAHFPKWIVGELTATELKTSIKFS